MCYLLQLPEVRASLNAGDSCGNTPLMEAARARHLACVRELLLLPDTELGTRDKMGRTVVQVAAQAGAVEVGEQKQQYVVIIVLFHHRCWSCCDRSTGWRSPPTSASTPPPGRGSWRSSGAWWPGAPRWTGEL